MVTERPSAATIAACSVPRPFSQIMSGPPSPRAANSADSLIDSALLGTISTVVRPTSLPVASMAWMNSSWSAHAATTHPEGSGARRTSTTHVPPGVKASS